MAKVKKKTQNDNIPKSKVFKVTDNCTVNLKAANNGGCKRIRISIINGYDSYAFLIGKKKGDLVRVDKNWWTIGYIEQDKRKKTYRRKYSLLSHPLNNTVHFVK